MCLEGGIKVDGVILTGNTFVLATQAAENISGVNFERRKFRWCKCLLADNIVEKVTILWINNKRAKLFRTAMD